MSEIEYINVGGVDYTLKDSVARSSGGNVPVDHSSTERTYGHGTNLKYGHVKLSDNYWELQGYHGEGIAASQGGVYDMYTKHVARTLKTVEKTNLNNLHDTGIYSYTNPSNRPDGAYGDVIVSTIGNDTYNAFINQMAVTYDTGIIATRYYDSSAQTWKPWHKFYADDESTGTATLNSTYCAPSSTGITYYKKGTVCYVKVQIVGTSSLTGPYTDYKIASGLPGHNAGAQYFLGNASVDGQNQGPHFDVRGNGDLYIHVRANSLAGSTIIGGFIYICD